MVVDRSRSAVTLDRSLDAGCLSATTLTVERTTLTRHEIPRGPGRVREATIVDRLQSAGRIERNIALHAGSGALSIEPLRLSSAM